MEYLVKANCGNFAYLGFRDKYPSEYECVIEIPEGAIKLTIDTSGTMTFWKNNIESMNVGQDKKWVSAKKDEVLTFSKYSQYDYDVLWQRDKVEVEDKKLDIKKVMAEAEMFEASNREHGHYYKDVSGLNIIDPYMVLKLFNVTDPCLQHIVKKALVAGGRGHKDLERDLKDIHDTSKRALEINNILH